MFLEGAFSVASSQTTKIQGYKDADALYAFKSGGFGGEIGLTTLNFSHQEVANYCIDRFPFFSIFVFGKTLRILC